MYGKKGTTTGEMEDKRQERKSIGEAYKNSLLAKLTWSMLKASLLLGTVLLIIGLALYTYSIVGQYIDESYTLAKSAANIVGRIGEPDDLAKMVMDVYREIPEDVRQNQHSAEYRERFDALDLDNNDAYLMVKRNLLDLRSASDISYLYIAVYDPETNAMVYICDPDDNPETRCQIGEWEQVPEREMVKFTQGDETAKVYDIGGTEHYGLMCTSGYPIGVASDDLHAYVLADITLQGVVRGVRLLVVEYAVAVILVLILLGNRLNKRVRQILVDPIERIGNAALKYTSDKKDGATASDHFDNLNIHTGDEIEDLVSIMADMEHNIGEHEKELVALTAEKERSHTELDLARRIQANMLPADFPAFPDRSDFDIYAVMNPAKEVGGDFYDFFLIDDNHLGLVMADVAGKGVPAALFMMSSMIIANNTAMADTDYDPGAILEKANNLIYDRNSTDMFVTMWLGILDTRTGVIRAANAGHEYPAVKQPGGSFELIKDRHGFVLGTMENMKYKSYDLQLEPGAKLFVYTDGVPEATNAAEELMGTERMLDALNSDPDASPKQLLENVTKAVDEYVADAPQFDDLTMLCIEWSNGAE